MIYALFVQFIIMVIVLFSIEVLLVSEEGYLYLSI